MSKVMDDILGKALHHPIFTGSCAMLLLLIFAMPLLPEGAASRERRIDTALHEGETVEIAKAGDGARLWAVRRGGKTIYFSKGSVAIDESGTEKGL